MVRTIARFTRFIGLIMLAALSITACQSQPNQPPVSQTPSPQEIFLSGTGAEFPYVIYQRWFTEYNRLHPNVQVSYQPTGSQVGIQQFIAGTIDFAGSDVAMSDAEIAQVSGGVVMVPMTAGSVVVGYNLPGIKTGLKLPRAVYPEIFLGKISRWNDPKIVAANPELNLPDLPIVVTHRSDGSGTTAAFTRHLSAISPEWQGKAGSGLSIQWPTGVGIKSNAGVSAQIQQQEGAIGYVEYTYAKQLNMPMAALENKSGQYVLPSPAAAAKALAGQPLPENLRLFVPDPAGADAYPIATYSWLLMYQNNKEPQKAQALKEMVRWCLSEGQKLSDSLGYVTLFPEVVQRAQAVLDKINVSSGGIDPTKSSLT